MSRVKLKVPVPIVKSCDPDSGRYALGSAAVYAQGNSNPWLVATNSRMLACYPLDRQSSYVELDEGEKYALIPNSCLPKNGKQFDQFVEFDGNRWFTEWGKSDTKVEGRFPRYTDVIPVFDEHDRYVQMSIDPSLLLDLAKSIAADQVTLLMRLPQDGSDNPRMIDGAIGVLGGEGGFGVIMPLSGGTDADVIESYAARRDQALLAGRVTKSHAMQEHSPEEVPETPAEPAAVPVAPEEAASSPSPWERLAAFASSRHANESQKTRIPA